MRKRAAALALALCVGLSGCALEREGRREDAPPLGRAAELAEETILLSVDGREIPAWRYLYWLAFTCDQIREKYEDGGMALDWGAPVTGAPWRTTPRIRPWPTRPSTRPWRTGRSGTAAS